MNENIKNCENKENDENQSIPKNNLDGITLNPETSDSNNDAENDNSKTNEMNKNKLTEKSNKNKKKHKGIKIAALVAAGIVVLAAGSYSIYVKNYDKIMPNTYIESINLGGLSLEEATASLNIEYNQDKLTGKTINLICMGDRSSIMVENISMIFEPQKMATDAYMIGRENTSFFNKLLSFTSSIFSENKITPSVLYDEPALAGAINDLCGPYETEPLGYTFRIGDNSDIVIAKPQDGEKVDMESAVNQVIDQICSFNFGDVEFTPVVTKAPDIDLDAFYNYITAPAEDATYAKDENNKVYVVPGKPQIVVNKSTVKAALNQPDVEYSIPVQLVNPAIDSAFLQSIMYEDTLGTYTTDYSASSVARASNIRLASNAINGLELMPGEKFDFNKVVGKRTPERGYQQAPVYVVKEGKTESEMDYGGGICQVSSTLFCAVNRTGLKVLARTSHSKDVTYVPKGMDATVSWGGPEFIFENSTDYPIRIFIDANGGTLTARIVGSKVSKPKINLDVQNDGNSVIVTKTTTNADGSTTQEIISSNTPAASQ